MSVTITKAGLKAAYPEWDNDSLVDSILDPVINLANALSFALYTDPSEEIVRRYVEASALLFDHPYARDLYKGSDAINPYRTQAVHMDTLKGGAYRAPGWSVPIGMS